VIARNVNKNRDAPHTFLQKKKGKKESRLALWRVSKKQVFFEFFFLV
jgi:hypothetical protein